MPTHVHIGGVQFLIFGLFVILWLFLLRVLETMFPNSAFGRALAYIH